ncbi:hypothetical protein BC835DRAFT_1420553 [Cytidiella melzeri]|nr:hypothetical protein BC835DRAFT_1420553 [Cytidiella melzeri]
MRAFDDICVHPNFEEQNNRLGKTIVTAAVCGVAAVAGYSIWLGRLPEVPAFDANSIRYVLRFAGLRP